MINRPSGKVIEIPSRAMAVDDETEDEGERRASRPGSSVSTQAGLGLSIPPRTLSKLYRSTPDFRQARQHGWKSSIASSSTFAFLPHPWINDLDPLAPLFSLRLETIPSSPIALSSPSAIYSKSILPLHTFDLNPLLEDIDSSSSLALHRAATLSTVSLPSARLEERKTSGGSFERKQREKGNKKRSFRFASIDWARRTKSLTKGKAPMMN